MPIPKARRFHLQLDTTNKAFKYVEGGGGGPAGPELARLLREIADKIEGVTDEQLLRDPDGLVRDCNGEYTGSYRLMFH